jgi:hypothetical protein
LPLSYCTNVHPGRTLAEVEEGLDRYTVRARDQFGAPLAAGLWLARSVVSELLAYPDRLPRFVDGLASRELTCHTLNAFPFGDFHSARVKENVYLPGWARAERLAYTLDCAAVLARLLPDGVEGSISTLPLGFKPFLQPSAFFEDSFANLIECAAALARLEGETRKTVRIAIEPEPLCLLETTQEAIEFFQRLWREAEQAGQLDAVQRHLGLCYDVCHQAVEFEDVAASIGEIDRSGVRINKVHLSCALRLDHPDEDAAARAALRHYIEPRYLHQTIARSSNGELARAVDLTTELLDRPDPRFAAAAEWRVHFHVPVDAERLGPLATTRPALRAAIGAVAALSYAPHLEVETYTWEVLPGAARQDLAEGLARELLATRQLLMSAEGAAAAR